MPLQLIMLRLYHNSVSNKIDPSTLRPFLLLRLNKGHDSQGFGKQVYVGTWIQKLTCDTKEWIGAC
jgi:hypothetical protein